jgi:spermidine synthase
MASHHWFIDDQFHNKSRAVMFAVKAIVASARSDYQEILIADLEDFGRALFLDGSPQSSALDEGIYHEALVHPALVACPAPQRVFVAGGGEGATVREILRHPTVQQVIMVDIDPLMISLARQHLSTWHQGAFDDPRVQVICEDARQYLANTVQTFDCIVSDVAEPLADSPAALLFTQEFFALARSRLAPGGTFALQAEAADVCDYVNHISLVKTLRTVFPTTLPYQVSIPFFSSAWGFVVAGETGLAERLQPSVVAQTLIERQCAHLSFYDAESHQHMFSQSRFLRQALADPAVGGILRDDHVLVIEFEA